MPVVTRKVYKSEHSLRNGKIRKNTFLPLPMKKKKSVKNSKIKNDIKPCDDPNDEMKNKTLRNFISGMKSTPFVKVLTMDTEILRSRNEFNRIGINDENITLIEKNHDTVQHHLSKTSCKVIDGDLYNIASTLDDTYSHLYLDTFSNATSVTRILHHLFSGDSLANKTKIFVLWVSGRVKTRTEFHSIKNDRHLFNRLGLMRGLASGLKEHYANSLIDRIIDSYRDRYDINVDFTGRYKRKQQKLRYAYLTVKKL